MAPQLWHCHEFANSYVCHCAMVASLIETGETEQKSSVVISCVLNWWYFTGCSGEGVHIKRQKEFTSVRWSATRQFPGWFGSSTGLKNACKKWTVPVWLFRCHLSLDQTCSSLLIHTAVLRLVTSLWEFCFGSSRNSCLRTQAWSVRGEERELGMPSLWHLQPLPEEAGLVTWFYSKSEWRIFSWIPQNLCDGTTLVTGHCKVKEDRDVGVAPFRSACAMTQPGSPDVIRRGGQRGNFGLLPWIYRTLSAKSFHVAWSILQNRLPDTFLNAEDIVIFSSSRNLIYFQMLNPPPPPPQQSPPLLVHFSTATSMWRSACS